MNFDLLLSNGLFADDAAMAMVFLVIYAVIIFVIIGGIWMTFVKAGHPGWAAIVPIYNVIVMLDIAGKPIWWVLLFFIPIVNLVVVVSMYFAIAENFGQGALFGLGLLLFPFIFFPILGFGDAQYGG